MAISWVAVGFLLNNGFVAYILNSLQTNLCRKSLTSRKTGTDRVDARVIASANLILKRQSSSKGGVKSFW